MDLFLAGVQVDFVVGRRASLPRKNSLPRVRLMKHLQIFTVDRRILTLTGDVSVFKGTSWVK